MFSLLDGLIVMIVLTIVVRSLHHVLNVTRNSTCWVRTDILQWPVSLQGGSRGCDWEQWGRGEAADGREAVDGGDAVGGCFGCGLVVRGAVNGRCGKRCPEKVFTNLNSRKKVGLDSEQIRDIFIYFKNFQLKSNKGNNLMYSYCRQ